MGINNKSKKKYLIILIFLLTSSVFVSAQDYAVTPISDFLENYKDKHLTISKENEERTDISFAKKLALYHEKISKLKEDFKKDREEEYTSKIIKRAKRHTCTGINTRNKTTCKPIIIDAPHENMYTKKDWVILEGSDEGRNVAVDSTSVNLELTASGKKTNKGVVYVTFKYRPELISIMVENDTDSLFKKIL